MRVAIVHDWLTGMRGGEKVLEVLCELFPDADLYTLIHLKGSVSKTIEKMKIKTSFLQWLPFIERRYRYYLPLFPFAIEQFNLDGYDLVLSSSHCVAKGVKKKPDTLHICYCYTPMRYVWDMYDIYFGRERSNPITRVIMNTTAHYLRRWDLSSCGRVDEFIAISHHVAKRIRRHYHRKAEVIYPPVNCSFYHSNDLGDSYYLIVSAFAPYKRIDLAIEAFNHLNLPLKIIGTGQEEKRLKKEAGHNIEFLGWKPDGELINYYAGCKALIFPGEEDFGIVPVEAMACGKPVIAYGKGGVLETVIPVNQEQEAWGKGQGENPTGIFFYEQTPEDLIGAVRFFEKSAHQFDRGRIRNHALRFDRSVFNQRIRKFIYERYEEFLNAKKTQRTF